MGLPLFRIVGAFLAMLLFASLQLEMCVAIKINIIPSRYTGENGEHIKMGCRLDDAEASAKEIMALKITKKDERALVILHPNNTMSYVSRTKNDVSATGKITSPVGQSYLDVIIKSPDMDDTGSYTCNIYYMDESGMLVEDKASAFLTVDDPDVKNVKMDIEKVKQMIESLRRMVNQVRQPHPLVAFSATNQRKFLMPLKNHHLVFPDVITQVGNNNIYNTRTGVFKAPVGGLYSFTLIIKVDCKGCFIRLQLVASSKVLFKLKVGSYHHDAQGAASGVVQLREGDIAYPYVDFVTPGTTLTPVRLSIFSGYLIQKYQGSQ